MCVYVCVSACVCVCVFVRARARVCLSVWYTIFIIGNVDQQTEDGGGACSRESKGGAGVRIVKGRPRERAPYKGSNDNKESDGVNWYNIYINDDTIREWKRSRKVK